MILKEVIERDWKQSRGRTMMLKHLDGKRLTRGEAILAKCAECNNGYIDGRNDCEMSDCPLHPFQPYKKR